MIIGALGSKVQYLNKLTRIISVYTLAVGLMKKHLEIPPILVHGFPLPLLLPLREISLTDLVEERHHHPFVTVLWLERRPPFPPFELVIAPVSC